MAQPVVTSATCNDSLREDWVAGVSALKSSRLSYVSSPFYALPWFLLIGHDSRKTSSILSKITTCEPISGENREASSLRWWPLKKCILIEPLEKKALSNDRQFWDGLSKLMVKTRRREPLNGVVVSIDVSFLSSSSNEELNKYGAKLRQNINKINDLYGVRVPVYLLVTGLENLSGFSQWSTALSPILSQQPMGFTNSAAELKTDDFISTALENIKNHLLDLRLNQNQSCQVDIEAINIPNRIDQIEQPLKQIFNSAFSENPYAENPLFNSIFFTINKVNEVSPPEDLFINDVFSRILPEQRFNWKQVRFSKRWKRLLQHALVASWFAACVVAVFFMYTSTDIAKNQLSKLVDANGSYTNVLENDVDILTNFNTTVESFSNLRNGTVQWLPFQTTLADTQDTLQKNLHTGFVKQIDEKYITVLFDKGLPLAFETNQPQAMSAWIDFLVIHINMSQDALDNEKVINDGSFASTLIAMFNSANIPQPNTLTAQRMVSLYENNINFLAKNYPTQLSDTKNQYKKILSDLMIEDRPNIWLDNWVKMKGNILPVEIDNYWAIDKSVLPASISSYYTKGGFEVVKSFLADVKRAEGPPTPTSNIEKQIDSFREDFINIGIEEWKRFLYEFSSSQNYLPNIDARQNVLHSISNGKGPYLKLINDVSQIGKIMDANFRPLWLKSIIKLNDAANESKSYKAEITIADEANKIGGKILGSISSKNRPLGVKLEGEKYKKNITELLADYHENLQKMIAPLLLGPGSSMKATREIWAYGYDANIKTVPFFNALKELNEVDKLLFSAHRSDDEELVRRVVLGPLDYTLDFSIRQAACSIQDDWEKNVVNSIQGIESKRQINKILYSKTGQLAEFLKGDISDFIYLDSYVYQPRIVNGVELPLTSQFYAFLNGYQKNKAKLVNDANDSVHEQSKVEKLTTENEDLKKEVEKLEKISVNVILKTQPVQVNAGAKILPQEVSLELLCASGSQKLLNLNFTNQATFSWTNSTCSDTSLNFIFSNGLTIKKTWSGPYGFVDFLKQFATGQHTFLNSDFPLAEKQLTGNGVNSFTLTYEQSGQETLFEDLKKLENVKKTIKTNVTSIQYTKDIQSGKIEDENPESIFLPKKIIRYCMEPLPTLDSKVNLQQSVMNQSIDNNFDDKQLQIPDEGIRIDQVRNKYFYQIRIGVFKKSLPIKKALKKKGMEVEIQPIKLNGQTYNRMTAKRQYLSLDTAKNDKEEIDKLLKLKNKSIILKHNNNRK